MKKLLVTLLAALSLLLLSCSSQEPTLSDTEMKEIARCLIKESLEVYDSLVCLNISTDEEVLIKDGSRYLKVSGYDSKNALLKKALEVYTPSAATRLFNGVLNGSDDCGARFTETSDGLWVATRGAMPRRSYPVRSIDVRDRSELSFTAAVDFWYTSATLRFEKTDDGWRLHNSVPEGEAEMRKNAPDNVATGIVTSDGGALILNTDALFAVDRLTDAEAKSIFIPLFKRAEELHRSIALSPTWSSATEFSSEYIPVDCPEVHTLSDVEALIHSVFTKECAERLYRERLSPLSELPRFIEKNGTLYFNTSSRGSSRSYDLSSLTLRAQYGNALIFTLDTLTLGEPDGRQVFVLEKSATGWLLALGFDESVSAVRIDGTLFKKAPEGSTVYHSSRTQGSLPAVITYGERTLTVSEPRFTGLYTDLCRTYKIFYAFENGTSVINACTDDGYRNYLVDLSGKITDPDYPHFTAISDHDAISAMPDGIKRVQTGKPGGYRYHLEDLEGNVLSREFHSIGSFSHDGIAPVTEENRVGFISSTGEVLLEPTIEFDRVVYPPDNREFYPVFFSDNAMILPIDGELAVIALE